MKRPLISLILLASIASSVWLFRRRSPSTSIVLPPIGTNIVAVSPVAQPIASPKNPGENMALPAKPTELTEEQWRYVLRRHQLGLAANGPITFYARALDQHDQPVPGVQLTISFSGYNESALTRLKEALRGQEGTESRSEKLVLLGDVKGQFSLTGKSGMALRVESVEREGYLMPELGFGSFDYQPTKSPLGRPHANPANPLLLRLWKRGESVPWFGFACTLARSDQEVDRFRINVFDKDARMSVERADLLLEVTALDTKPNDNGWLMEYKLSAPTGGIQETTDAIPYLAPAEGYKSFWSLRERKQVVTDGQPKVFFLKTRNGQVFANFKLIVKGGYLKIEGRVNARGSRILEPDPAKAIGDPDEISRLDELTAKK